MRLNDVGIYRIKNTINGKVYIGQSRTLIKRINDHKNKLTKNKHHNEHLQRAFNKYGADVFLFEVIEYCSIDNLYKRENHWINEHQSFNRERGYNIEMPDATMESKALTEETKKKISEAHMQFSDEELLSYLQEFFYMEGRVPTQRDLTKEKFGKYPHFKSYFDRFGSFKDGLIYAGLYNFVENEKMFNRKELTREDIIANYQEFVDKHGRFPSSDERRYTSKSGLYAESSVARMFDSMEELKSILGFSKEALIKKENDESLVLLKELYDEQGFVESRSIDKSRITRSVKFYSNRFGSLYNAYLLAGIDPEENLRRSTEAKSNHATYKLGLKNISNYMVNQ